MESLHAGVNSYSGKGAAIGSAEPPRHSLVSATETAQAAQKRLAETLGQITALADSAEALATRLSGPYPTEASNRDQDYAREPSASLAAVQALMSAIGGVHERISVLDAPLSRLGRALAVIDRSVG